MSLKDIERLKELLEKKNPKSELFVGEKKIGVGKVQQRNKYIGTMKERTKTK